MLTFQHMTLSQLCGGRADDLGTLRVKGDSCKVKWMKSESRTTLELSWKVAFVDLRAYPVNQCMNGKFRCLFDRLLSFNFVEE